MNDSTTGLDPISRAPFRTCAPHKVRLARSGRAECVGCRREVELGEDGGWEHVQAWKPEIPETPRTEAALRRIAKLGEELEGEGHAIMARARATTSEGHAIRWLGMRLQELVNDGVLDEEYGGHVSTQEG